MEKLPFMVGLTEEIILAGASSRAHLDDVAVPRRAGYTKQDVLQCFSFQLPSKNDATMLYTVMVSLTVDRVAGVEDILATCSCPFNATKWCKHIVRCLKLVVDPSPDTSLVVATPAPEFKKPATRRAPRSEQRRCVRCDKDYESARNRRGSCKRAHPRSLTRDRDRCARCGEDPATVAFCFVGTHTTELAKVDAEGWPSDESEDDEAGGAVA